MMILRKLGMTKKTLPKTMFEEEPADEQEDEAEAVKAEEAHQE